MNPVEIIAAARSAANMIDRDRAEMEEKIDAIRKRIEELPVLSESDGFTVMAKAMQAAIPATPNATVEVGGPQGIDCLMSLNLRRDGKTVSSLTFRPSVDGGYRMVDHDVDTKQYALGTMAAMNGMNHPDVPMPEDVGVLTQLLIDQEKARRKI